MLHVYDSICRNNAIVCGSDAGIELAWVDGVKVFHNTVWRQNVQGRGIRCIEKLAKVEIVNNLCRGALALADGASARNNLVGTLEGLFVDPAAGNLRLTADAAGAIDKAVSLADVTDDLNRHQRGELPDLGAVEFAPK